MSIGLNKTFKIIAWLLLLTAIAMNICVFLRYPNADDPAFVEPCDRTTKREPIWAEGGKGGTPSNPLGAPPQIGWRCQKCEKSVRLLIAGAWDWHGINIVHCPECGEAYEFGHIGGPGRGFMEKKQ